METIIGNFQPLTEQQRVEQEQAYEKARVIAWQIWFAAYESGSLSLEELLRHARRSLEKLRIDDFLRWKTLGQLVEHALKIHPPKRSRGNKGKPKALREIAISLVELANKREGHVLSRGKKSEEQTAFEFVAGLMANLGIAVTPRQIELWKYPP